MNRATVGQLALLLVGLGLLVASGSIDPSPGGLTVSLDEEPRASVPEGASVVAFEDLLPATQDAFQRAFDGGDGGAFDGDDRTARLPADTDTERLASYDYVRYRGRYYGFSVISVDNVGSGGTFLAVALGIGAIAAVGLWRLTGTDEVSRDGPPPPEP
ncbi:hypothetical protein [Haloplanus natans]|uniref:hypothetical protein n=1 Tax=Haloplanus natans TaxID=376171 RepID=UPI000677D2F4|nr:hypothetical protein [Haloplanus natans]